MKHSRTKTLSALCLIASLCILGACGGEGSRFADTVAGDADPPQVPAPTIDAIAPDQAMPGVTITITGTNFAATPDGNLVTLNGTAAEVTAASATQLQVIVPKGSDAGPVRVTVGELTAVSSGNFTYVPVVWESLSAGSFHVCGSRSDGSAWCWGSNIAGELGNGGGNAAAVRTPQRVGDDSDWVSVSAGGGHSCGVRADGSVWCWGTNWIGQLGNGTDQDANTPQRAGIDSDWTSVFAGLYQTCGLRTDRSAWCWGYDLYGLPDNFGTSNYVPNPRRVDGAADWLSLAPGNGSTCGLRADHSAWCWGSASSGVFDDLGGPLQAPARLGSALWNSLSVSSFQACGVRTDGTLWCWGTNFDGSLGNGSLETSVSTPAQQVGSGADWVSVVTGYQRSCGLRSDGSAWCWGNNDDGALGNGNTQHAAVPQRVEGDADWISLTAGQTQVCGLRADGSAWCWGSNENGQLGTGALAPNSLVPVRVMDPP